MTDEVKSGSRARWRSWPLGIYQLFWLGYFLHRYLWPVLVSGGKKGVPELLTGVGVVLLILALAVLIFSFRTTIWLRLSEISRVRMIWMACVLPTAALPFMVGGPKDRSVLSKIEASDPTRVARELALFAVLTGLAYAFAYAGTALAGWRRNLTCLAVATATWCAIWTAIALGAPPNAADRLSSILLIGGPVVIAWSVALSLWRIDLSVAHETS